MKLRRDAPWLALAILTAIYIVGFADRIVLNVLAIPIQREFGLSDTQVGLMTGLAFSVLNVTLAIVVARYAERGSRITLVAVGTLLWSIATALCGFVSSFTGLLLARIGVGVGEAVGLPANQSIVADFFPPSRRATAMSVLLLAPPVGAFLGSAGGGWIGQEYGWRTAFLVATVPGLVLALLAWLLIAEPPRGRYDAEASTAVPPIRAVAGRLFGLPSARQLLFGSTLASMVGFGLNAFLVILLTRKFGLPLAQAGLLSGLIGSLPGAIAVLGGGRIADALGARNPAAYALVPGFALIVGGALYIAGILQTALVPMLALISIGAVFQYAYLGVTFGVFQNLMHSRMRATGYALLNAIYGLIGQGLGTVMVGVLSDRLAPLYGASQALVYALAIGALLYFWAGAHYLLAARHLKRDLAAVRETPAAEFA
ncbi:MAG: MFS transporter [Croceibacterium sp.]